LETTLRLCAFIVAYFSPGIARCDARLSLTNTMSGHNDSEEEIYFAGGEHRSCDSRNRADSRS
jgi:hypothetical protein